MMKLILHSVIVLLMVILFLTPASIKYRQKEKYEAKLLVWICMSEKGISSPIFLRKRLCNQSIDLFGFHQSLVSFIKIELYVLA